MPNEHKRKRPEAGADTDPEVKNPRSAQSGGHRSAAGGTYGDFVPDRGLPRRNDDRDAGEPKTPRAPHSAETAGSGPAADPQEAADSEEERLAEEKSNKSFDTTHVHSATTTRKV